MQGESFESGEMGCREEEKKITLAAENGVLVLRKEVSESRVLEPEYWKTEYAYEIQPQALIELIWKHGYQRNTQ